MQNKKKNLQKNLGLHFLNRLFAFYNSKCFIICFKCESLLFYFIFAAINQMKVFQGDVHNFEQKSRFIIKDN